MKQLKNTLFFLVLGLVAVGMLLPLIWMLIYSLKSFPEGKQGLIDLIFSPYTFNNFQETLESDQFDLFFFNSIIVAFFVTAGNVLFCLFAGYALARKKFPGSRYIFFTILAVMIIPPHVIMIPLYRLMVEFGWINSYWALIVPWLVTPFGIFLVRQYLLSIPSDMEDSARVDGAGEWYIIIRIVMPLARPVLTVLAIYIFLNNWNSFLFPYLFTNDEFHRTLPVGLAFYLGKQSIDWGNLMAGAAISAIPVLILFVIFQKTIVKGLIAGALKE